MRSALVRDGVKFSLVYDNKKMIFTMVDGSFELYDLQTDIGETKNVTAEHPDIVKKLDELIDSAHVDTPRWSFKPKPKKAVPEKKPEPKKAVPEKKPEPTEKKSITRRKPVTKKVPIKRRRPVTKKMPIKKKKGVPKKKSSPRKE